MKKLIILTIFIIIAGLGYMQFTQYQHQLEIEQSLAKMEQEKAELQAAKEKNSVGALNRFISEHPQSNWINKAIFERDGLAYHLATKNNEVAELEAFINQYSDSQWIPQAKNRLQRMKQEKKLLDEMVEKQHQLDIQRVQLAEQQKQQQQKEDATQQPSETSSPEKTTSNAATTTNPNRNTLSGKDRVARALSIYQKQRQQEALANQQKQQARDQAQAKEDQLNRQCVRMKDLIAQYNNPRLHWYDLDGSGKRVYLNKYQVSVNKKRLLEQYHEKCE